MRFSMTQTMRNAGMKYWKNIVRYGGFIAAFPASPTSTATIATNTAGHGAKIVLGSPARFTLRRIFPIPNNAMTHRKEIV